MEDLEFLLRYYKPIGLLEVIHWIQGNANLPSNSMLLTFDDGFREVDDIIAPLLIKKGIPASFFIPSAFIDNRALYYRHKASLLVEKGLKGISPVHEHEIQKILLELGISFSHVSEGILKVDYKKRAALERIAEILHMDFQLYLDSEKPYLTSNQVRNLIKQGFTIGAHSIDHPHYSTISLEDQLDQTIGSIKSIRDTFGLNYGAFAFPHNDTGVSQEFYNRVQESGLVDITFGTGGMFDSNIFNHLQRVDMEKPMLPARELLAWHYARRLFHHSYSCGR